MFGILPDLGHHFRLDTILHIGRFFSILDLLLIKDSGTRWFDPGHFFHIRYSLLLTIVIFILGDGTLLRTTWRTDLMIDKPSKFVVVTLHLVNEYHVWKVSPVGCVKRNSSVVWYWARARG